MALVLREVQIWFGRKYAAIYNNEEIIWQMNVGIPVENYDDDGMVMLFKRIAHVGWYLAETKEPINIDSAREAPKYSTRKLHLSSIYTEDINVIPEVAAEVAGYARSNLRNSGLHLLIDIGASFIYRYFHICFKRHKK